MCKYEKTIIALDEEHIHEFSDPAVNFLMTCDMLRHVKTPDNTYFLYCWEWREANENDRDTDAYAFFSRVENIRHSILHITEDNEVFRDISTSDKWGCDEEFEEILGVTILPNIWSDTRDIILFQREKDEMIPPSALEKAAQCLIDNGIEEDEATTVLEALGYILLNQDIFDTEKSPM